jgi:hypothetical protein
MPLFMNPAVPDLLGSNLMRFAPMYVAMAAIQPQVKHKFDAVRTKTVQLERFKRFPQNAMSKLGRRRTKTQILGTANSEGLTKSLITMDIFQYTGPATSTGDPSTLWMTLEDILYARSLLWEEGLSQFHKSIGSENLADDFQCWFDSVLIGELANTTQRINPSGKLDAATVITDRITTNDLFRVRFALSNMNTPRYPDGTYHGIIDEVMLYHLLQDSDFKQYAVALIQGGAVPVNQTPIIQGPQASGSMMMGMPGQRPNVPLPPIVYQGFTLYSSNNVPKRTVNALQASLGYFFGPDSVGIGSGGRGPEVLLHSDTDFSRHYRFIHSWWGDAKYLLDDDASSGAAVELRTFGAV